MLDLTFQFTSDAIKFEQEMNRRGWRTIRWGKRTKTDYYFNFTQAELDNVLDTCCIH